MDINNKSVKTEKKSVIKILIIFVFITVALVLIALYITNEDFRNNIDKNILKKNLTEENLKTIQINSEENPIIYAYDKYITILNKNVLTLYNKDGQITATINVNINNPIIDSNNKYLVLAEKKGKKFYVTSESNLLWQKDVDGEISGITVNKNGYVSVIITNTTHKSVIITYDSTGTELFKTFLSKKYALCTSISDDNKYLAIGEINYSGSIIKSSVKIISIEEARKTTDNVIVHTYEAENGEILSNLKYYGKNNVICMFTNYIESVSIDGDEKVLDIDNNTSFLDINLNNQIIKVEKESTGLFSNSYQMRIINPENKKENLYILNNGIPKEVKVYGNIILMNLGTEVEIVDTNGWLLKKYTSKKQIKDVVLSDNIVGIIYKDKIEIINI